MRSLCYSFAMSLDGRIAGPAGEHDWIPADPDIDFAGLFERFDTILMGRKTWDTARAQGGPPFRKRTVVFSRTLDPDRAAGAEVSRDPLATVRGLKEESGGDLWLMGGGGVFRELLAAGLVDEVEAAVVPILLGQGTPFLLPGPDARFRLELHNLTRYPKSGIVLLRYRVLAS